MEHFDEIEAKELRKAKIRDFVFMVLIITIIVGQIMIVGVVIKHYKALNTDPLVFGAQKYNLPECICHYDQYNWIIFNQNESKTVQKYVTGYGPDSNLNETQWREVLS